MHTLILSAQDVVSVLRQVGRDAFMDSMIESLSTGLRELGEGKLGSTPARGGFTRDVSADGLLEWMPHHEPGRSATVKMVSYTPSNADTSGLPTILGTVSRYDDSTGRLTALADAVVLTAFRTGAASALASRLLASPDSAVVGLFGTGAQAVSQLHALSRVFDVRRVLVFDTRRDNAESFLIRSKFLDLDVQLVTPEQVCAEADIICTATTNEVGAEPVFRDQGLRPHVHVNAIGADQPGKTELPIELLRRAFVCPDHLEQARREGECQRLEPVEIGPELPVLCARPELARPHRRGATVFDSTGFALEDHLALDVLLDFAVPLGLGSEIDVEYHPHDALDPYPDESAVEVPGRLSP